jgi:hypothetical protein
MTIDPGGTLGVFYRLIDGALWVSSSPELLRRLDPELPLSSERLEWGGELEFFPGPLSGVPGISRLLPSQRLDLRTGEITERPLLPPLEHAEHEELLREHHLIPSEGPDKDAIRLWEEHTCRHFAFDRDIPYHLQWRHLPADAVILGGNLFETARCYHHLKRPDAPAVYRAWTEARPSEIDWRDRPYLEQRIGSWLSSHQQGLDMTGRTLIQPANDAMLLALMLSFPEKPKRTRFINAISPGVSHPSSRISRIHQSGSSTGRGTDCAAKSASTTTTAAWHPIFSIGSPDSRAAKTSPRVNRRRPSLRHATAQSFAQAYGAGGSGAGCRPCRFPTRARTSSSRSTGRASGASPTGGFPRLRGCSARAVVSSSCATRRSQYSACPTRALPGSSSCDRNSACTASNGPKTALVPPQSRRLGAPPPRERLRDHRPRRDSGATKRPSAPLLRRRDTRLGPPVARGGNLGRAEAASSRWTDEALNAIAERAAAIVIAQVSQHVQSENEPPSMTIAEAADHLRCKRQRIDDLLSSERLARAGRDGRLVLLARAGGSRHTERVTCACDPRGRLSRPRQQKPRRSGAFLSCGTRIRT